MCLLPFRVVGLPQFYGANFFMSQIEWVPVPSLENRYHISRCGKLKSLPKWRNTGTGGYLSKEKILAKRRDTKGYVILEMSRPDGSFYYVKRSRLIAKLWIPNPNNLPVVNHINGIKDDDSVENLEWCTDSENEFHAYRTGLKKAAYLGKFGKDHNQSIPVLAIKETSIIEFESKTACGIYFGTTVQNVYRAMKSSGELKGYKLYSL